MLLFVCCYYVIVYDVCGVGLFGVLMCMVDYYFVKLIDDFVVVIDVFCFGCVVYFVVYDWGLI